MFELARSFNKKGMLAYSDFQQQEFKFGKTSGYMATIHQSFVGAHYVDHIMGVISGDKSTVLSMKNSTEEAQFTSKKK